MNKIRSPKDSTSAARQSPRRVVVPVGDGDEVKTIAGYQLNLFQDIQSDSRRAFVAIERARADVDRAAGLLSELYFLRDDQPSSVTTAYNLAMQRADELYFKLLGVLESLQSLAGFPGKYGYRRLSVHTP